MGSGWSLDRLFGVEETLEFWFSYGEASLTVKKEEEAQLLTIMWREKDITRFKGDIGRKRWGG